MKNIIKKVFSAVLPYFSSWVKYKEAGIKSVPYLSFLKFKLFGDKVYWYYHKSCIIANPKRIFVGKNSLVGREGCYIQGAGGVYIGNYVRIAPNVGILSSNHDFYDHGKASLKSIKIDDYCWLGMNSIVTAGVELGPRTIVAAGAVVTKSFEDGFCVLAGNPAKVIRLLDKEKFMPWRNKEEWYGFLNEKEFEKQKKKYLNI